MELTAAEQRARNEDTRLECVRSAVNHIASMNASALLAGSDRDVVALATKIYAFVSGEVK